MQIKPLAAVQGGIERYRVVFSDMQNFVQTMLATRESAVLVDMGKHYNTVIEVNHFVHDGKLQNNSIVRLKNFNANVVKGKQ